MELARALIDEPDPPAQPRRRMSEYSVQVEMLTAILDRLGEVVQAIASSAGAKPRKLKPAPRPVTAMETLRHKRSEHKHRQIVARVLPHGGDLSGWADAIEEADVVEVLPEYRPGDQIPDNERTHLPIFHEDA